MKQRGNAFVAGFIAGIVARVSVAPLDRIKVLCQAGGKEDHIVSVTKRIWKEGGIKAFWHASSTGAISHGPKTAIKFLTQNFFKSILTSSDGHISPLMLSLVGPLSGAVSETVVYPLDVAYVRRSTHPTRYPSLLQTFSKMIHDEGFGSLYSGWIPNMIGILPYQGIHYFCYEGLRELYLNSHEKVPMY
uniref:Mitochondrial carrier protein n=1 Tax=Coptotermes formosanus TaxID=36987 RepID=R4UKA8_COPFO|nr:mitochondrial carrier protein [Coptotermes formosanus]